MSNVIGLSEEHEDNLRTLVEYLKQPELKAEFHMRRYTSLGNAKDATECGTVGCAVGHGPHAGIVKAATEYWGEYCSRVFGVYDNTAQWEWCFSDSWAKQDNSPIGAAHRIEWMLERGVPVDWFEQMGKRAPLCYREGATQ